MTVSSNVDNGRNPHILLTRKSLALSLTAPRVPPHGTAHRALLAGVDSTNLPWTPHHQDERKEDHHKESLRRRIVNFLRTNAGSRRLPHPHLPMDPEFLEHVTRFLGALLPVSLQNWVRDSGTFRAIGDNSLKYSAPIFVLASPSSYLNFRYLSQRCQTIKYGKHPMQIIDLFLPERQQQQPRGLIFFVHGGGWGVGNPRLYRLVAVPFLNMGLAVAIVGYRTYPCGHVKEQVLDLEVASSELAQHHPELCQQQTEIGVVVMGHSSGAHITLLMIAERARLKMESLEISIKKGVPEPPEPSLPSSLMRIDHYVGISGPYNVSHHFDYEASRGLEELSPLKATFYFTREDMLRHSPVLRILECTSKWSNECKNRALDNILPRILLVHGIEDDIVPFTSSAEAAALLRSCGVSRLEEIYLASTLHNDTMIHLMIGGQLRDVLVEWLENIPKTQHAQQNKTMVMQSKL